MVNFHKEVTVIRNNVNITRYE